MNVKWQAPDISCAHCAMAIKRGLATVPGVTQVEVDVAAKTVSFIAVDMQSVQAAQTALTDLGYPPTAP